jgi:hypothetical protein
LERFVTRRTQELEANTRSEILTSIGAAVFFVAVISWRFQATMDRLPQLGVAAVGLWVAFIVYRFRAQIVRASKSSADALAVTGVEHYRTALTRRRDHLKYTWIWHGPMILACLTLLAILIQHSGFERLRSVLPFVGILILWVILAQTRRHRLAAGLQRDLDELEPIPPAASRETPLRGAPPK